MVVLVIDFHLNAAKATNGHSEEAKKKKKKKNQSKKKEKPKKRTYFGVVTIDIFMKISRINNKFASFYKQKINGH